MMFASSIMLMLLATLMSWSLQASTKCEQGECIPRLVTKLENLGKLYQQECLPKKIPPDLETYHREHGLSEKCWKYITEIEHLDSELSKHQSRLESGSCSNGKCQTVVPPLNDIQKINNELSCTAAKKIAVSNQCNEDLNCIMQSTMLSLATAGAGAYVLDGLLPKSKNTKCNLANDSCVTQLATSFFKSAFTYFNAAWDILKSAGKFATKKMTQFWNWVSQAEDHSSTAQLALAKASEDPSVFRALIDDFPGTMKKVWFTFVASIKEWLRSGIFCQKWQGVPHFSTCLQPTNDYDCLPCKTLVTGLCGITGTVVAEVIPSFMTGGLVSAVKHGITGATRIAKGIKISAKSIKVIQSSSLGKKLGHLSKGVAVIQGGIQVSLKALRTYLLSPARKTLKASYLALKNLTKKGAVHVAQSATGKTIIFSGKVAKKTLQVVLYPVDNPLTTMAYKAGAKTIDTAVRLGKPKLISHTAVTASLLENSQKLEPLLVDIELARMPAKTNIKKIVKLEQELYTAVLPNRQTILRSSFKKGLTDVPDIIKKLYPELQYGPFAKTLPKSKIILAEKELLKEINRLPKSMLKQNLTSQYHALVGVGMNRTMVLGAPVVTTRPPLAIPNVTTGVNKILSPTLRGTHESNRNKEEKK